jgi:CRISPR system Cascade subunit CasB
LLEGIPPHAQDAWFLVAALLALYPQPLEREHPISFARSCAILSARMTSGGPERRFKSLLDTDGDDLVVPLVALIRLMQAKDVPVDYVPLLQALRHWDHPDQWVQDRWARDFWGPHQTSSELATSSTDR